MISLLKGLLGSRPDALAATSPWAQSAQPLSAPPAATAVPGSGLVVLYRHVGWCGFCGFDPCRCETGTGCHF